MPKGRLDETLPLQAQVPESRTRPGGSVSLVPSHFLLPLPRPGTKAQEMGEPSPPVMIWSACSWARVVPSGTQPPWIFSRLSVSTEIGSLMMSSPHIAVVSTPLASTIVISGLKVPLVVGVPARVAEVPVALSGVSTRPGGRSAADQV